MKTNTFIFIALATIFAACISSCGSNIPKQEKNVIPSVALTETQKSQLSAIFDASNALLETYHILEAEVISSQEELSNICPQNLSLPDIDWDKNCLVFIPLELSSVNDLIENSQLYQDNENNRYEYIVTIRKCTECYTVMCRRYAFGVYPLHLTRSQILSSILYTN